MGKKEKQQLCWGGIAGVFLVIGLIGLTGAAPPISVDQRADVILIDSIDEANGRYPLGRAEKKMPAVAFLHDRHTRTLEGDTCRSCHAAENGRLVFLYNRLETGDPENEREVYHANCIGCHADRASVGMSSGPLNANCRQCHSRTPEKPSSWVPLKFTPSLHYRHESAELIPPDPDTKTNCGACHHQYDPARQETTYRKGEEESCQYCHPSQAITEGRLLRPSRFGIFRPTLTRSGPEAIEPGTESDEHEKAIRFMSAAAHDSCVACHRRLASDQDRKTGPADCAGCHTLRAQRDFKVLENVPRMNRQQPDAVLMAAWLHGDDLSPEAVSTEIDPVAFNHKAHEGYKVQNESCRRCHHNALQACGECHVRKGAARGDFISLNQAMHAPTSTTSCVGCHRNQTVSKSDCAGCHTTASVSKEQSCRICHEVDKTILPGPPMDKTTASELAAAAVVTRIHNREAVGTLPPLDKVPEKVKIDVLMETYEAVELPHGKIIRDLDRRIKTSELAQTFHSNPLTMCAGCHHHSPASLKPPKCISCHSPHQPGMSDGRPALAAAYHNQCMGCHHRMDITKPQATACNECHPKRNQKQ
jgi:hypothetical protein